jgi:hypothetical protein
MQSTACSNIFIEGSSTYKTYIGVSANTQQLLNEASDYEHYINRLLIQIKQWRLGSIVLSEIDQLGGKNWDKVTICRPMTVAEAANPGYVTWPKDSGATPLGKPINPEDALPSFYDSHPSVVAGSFLGTGTGSDALIVFDPRMSDMNSLWASGWRGSNRAHHLGLRGLKRDLEGPDGYYYELLAWQDDESLLHELVHALRILQGQWYPQVVGSRWTKRYDSTEEFYGILIANIYLSEKGKTVLRSDHQQGALSKLENTSELFLRGKDNLKDTRDNLALVKHLSHTSPSLFHQIVQVKPMGGFNPIREYVINRKLYN